MRRGASARRAILLLLYSKATEICDCHCARDRRSLARGLVSPLTTRDHAAVACTFPRSAVTMKGTRTCVGGHGPGTVVLCLLFDDIPRGGTRDQQ